MRNRKYKSARRRTGAHLPTALTDELSYRRFPRPQLKTSERSRDTDYRLFSRALPYARPVNVHAASPRRKEIDAQTFPSRDEFKDLEYKREIGVCVRRRTRREVLHALGVAGARNLRNRS